MITHTGGYAIRAMTYLVSVRGRTDRGGNVPAAEIAEATDVPENYLRKILYGLARAGILESTRGPKGGFRLAEPAERLTLHDVLASFEAVDNGGCILGPEPCLEGDNCPSHDRCLVLTGQVEQFLRTTRVVELIADFGEEGAGEAE